MWTLLYCCAIIYISIVISSVRLSRVGVCHLNLDRGANKVQRGWAAINKGSYLLMVAFVSPQNNNGRQPKRETTREEKKAKELGSALFFFGKVLFTW